MTLTPYQMVSVGIEYGGTIIILLSFLLVIVFLAILDSIDGGHVSNRQSNASSIYIYIYIYMWVCICL